MKKNEKTNGMNVFDEYKRLGEPEKKEKSEIWQTAIGLQQVDRLTPSKYLIELAKKHIEGEITIHEVNKRLNDYYKAKSDNRKDGDTVFSLIKKMPKITSTKIAENLGVGIATVKREIKRLKDSGCIERVGSDKTGYWRVIKNDGGKMK